KVQRHGTLRLRADAIHPVVTGHKITTGPADGGDFQVPYLLQVFLPETVLVGMRRIGIVQRSIDDVRTITARKRLEKAAVDVGVDRTDGSVEVDFDQRWFCGRKIPEGGNRQHQRGKEEAQ